MKLTILFLVFTLSRCFSELRAPAITFTQTQTAAEKQMIGEDRELEKDGWLISSIKTSSSGTEDWRRDETEEEKSSETAKEIISLQRSLAYTAHEIKTLKLAGVLGEGLDGQLHRVDTKTENDKFSSPESQKKIDELTRLVNTHRTNLRKIFIARKKNLLTEEQLKEYQKSIQLEYYNAVETGEFFEKGKGKWGKKE